MKNFKTKLFCLLVISTLIFPLFLFQSPYPVAEAAYGGDPDQWQYELDDISNNCGISAWNELFFTGDNSGNVYCFNSVDNTLNWTVVLPRPILRTPTVQYDVLVINADPQYLGLNPYNGNLIFNYTHTESFGAIHPILSTDNNLLYLRDKQNNATGSNQKDARVLAINLTTYTNEWLVSTLYVGPDYVIDNIPGDMIYSDDTIYFQTESYNSTSSGWFCRLFAINATTGVEIWQEYAPSSHRYLTGVIDTDVNILYIDGGLTLGVVNASNGEELWSFEKHSGILRRTSDGTTTGFPPIVVDNYVFTNYMTSDYLPMMICFNKLTGEIVYNSTFLNGVVYTKIIEYQDYLFFGTNTGFFYCMHKNGEIIWSFDTCRDVNIGLEISISSNNVYFLQSDICYSFDYLLGPKTYELTILSENIEAAYFFDDFEGDLSKWTDEYEEAEISDVHFSGEHGLFISDWDEFYADIDNSETNNFTISFCNKIIPDFSDLQLYFDDKSYITALEMYWSTDYEAISVDINRHNYYLGKIDEEWVISESWDFLTPLNTDLINNWINYTFIFETDSYNTNIAIYLNNTYIDTINTEIIFSPRTVCIYSPGYYDDISVTEHLAQKTYTYQFGLKPSFHSTNPSFTGWLVNGELVSTDPIYTLDVEDDEITIEITTSGITNSVLQLPFDNETSTVAYDWSLRNNHGAITGASRTYDGYYGMSLAFDGNDYVTVIDDNTLDATSSFMFSTQIKPTSFTDGTLIDKPSAYGVYTTSNGKIKVMINDDYFTTSASVLTLNQWNHVWVVYTGYDVAIYVNSIEKLLESYTETIYSSPYDLIIGYEFIGNIDEVQFYSDIYSDNPLLPIATYPYIYGGFIDTTACSWVVASLSYNFTGSYIRQNSIDPITYAEFNFTDGTDVIGLSYTASTGSYTTSGNDKVSFVSYNSIQSYNALLLYGRIRIESTIVSSQNIDLNLYCTTATSSDSLIIDNRFAIYGLGGVTSTTVVGDGALIAGGSVFDIMAQNSSLTEGGSSILVSTVAPNFQHLHTLTHLYQSAQWDEVNGVWDCPSFCSETGYLEFGVDYMEENCTWLNGWKTRIYIVDGGAGTGAWFAKDQSWVRLNVTWWNNNELIKYDDVYAFYEAYDENDTTTQISLYIDLWISEDEYSSNVAGHVSSQYYGMEEGGWWLWSNWQPVGSLQTSSTFYDNLYNGDGNLTSASTLKMFNVWSKIAKTGVGEGDTSCDEHLWASINEVVQIKQLPYNVELIGIASPIFMPTTTPDTPLGFFASIGNTLANALDSIYYAIATLAQGALTLTSSVLDSVFGLFGITGFTSSITSIIGGFATYFTQSITYVSSLIISIFTLFSSVVLFIIEWIGRVISTLIQIGDIVVGILNGTGAITTEIGNIWEWIKIDTWFSFIPIVMVIYWFNSIDQRAKQTGGGWMSILMGDINSIISVISFIFDFAWRVISTVIDLSMRFINVFI